MENHSSSPIPWIGLYTAAITSVCFLCMILDLLHGLRSRKPWFPCRFFSLNSLTLTLLAIATKLPLDLTTSMPSAHDQISKLTGTVFICISMGFFFPSLGAQSPYERLSNLASLTIFVITVIVNISIQMATRVIFAFIVEHVIILSFMLLLLFVLWESTLRLHFDSDVFLDDIKEQLEKGTDPQSLENQCMIHRIKLFYMSSYGNNPQLFLIDSFPASNMCIIPLICSVVLLQAAIRSLVLNNKMEFGHGVSDYKWSIWMVVVTQFLTITVGCIAIGFRWHTFVSNTDPEEKYTFRGPNKRYLSIISRLKSLRFTSSNKFSNTFQYLVKLCASLLPLLLTMSATNVMSVIKKCFIKQRNGETTDLVREELYLHKTELIRWIQKKSEEDMKRLVEKYKVDFPTPMFHLFCKTTPSQDSLSNKLRVSSENRISCLSVVLLVRMAIVSLPDSLSSSLVHTLDEAFEIIYFIDKKMNAPNLRNKAKWMMAKYMFKYNKRIKLSVKKHCSEVVMRCMDGGFQSQSQLKVLDDELGIIEEIPLDPDMISLVVRDDVHAINEFIIKCRPCASINELYSHMEQLFVDMLEFFFSQLSHAILKHIVESPSEQSEERASFALKLLSKVVPIEDKVHWSFPIGTGITSLITPHGHSRDAHRIEQVVSTAATHVAVQVAEDCEIQEHA